MAKVMISMPDELLAQVDRIAQNKHTSRSATIRAFTEQALEARRERMRRLFEELEIGKHAEPHGGDVARQVKEGRPN